MTAVTAVTGVPGTVTSPVRPPEGWTDDRATRDLLWFLHGNGDEVPEVPSDAWRDEPPAERYVGPPPPDWVRSGERRPLPGDVRRRLEELPYPRLGDVDGAGDVGSVLVAAFGLQWHDLENPYNAHRCYPSPRCLYPGQVLAAEGGRWSMLDVDGHALVAGPATGDDRRIALTGRWTKVPGSYRFARGTLVALELGIMLRALGVGLALNGVAGQLHAPGAAGRELLAEAGLTTAGEWSLPLVIDLGARAAVADPAPAPTPPARPTPTPDDPILARIEAIDRAQAFPAGTAPLHRAVPEGLAAPPDGPSWAQTLWRRTSGRVVRRKLGISARPETLAAPDFEGMLRWAGVDPPGADLVAARAHVRMTLAVAGVDGLVDGVYDAPAAADGPLVLREADRTVMTRLEAGYGHLTAPNVGCDVRYCSAVWFLTLRPRPLVDEWGPGGWNAGLRAVGWIAHGLCLGAAAAGRFGRPVREFREEPTLRALGRDADEMLPLAVVVGAGRHGTSGLLDLRP